MIKSKQRILILIALIVILTSVLFSFFAGITYCAAENYNKFDDINVFDDLKSSTVKGEPFDLNNYRPNGTKQMELINFAEYCYSFDEKKQGNYGLYIYIFNPQQLDLDAYNVGNKIQLATSFRADGEPNTYEKFELSYCNKSTDANYKNVFYKFKVKMPNKILPIVKGKEVRKYYISGVELKKKGGQVVEYKVAHTYSFSGYAQGCGQTDVSTLTCKITDLETIELNLNSTQFRTESSSAGKWHQNQLDSVYFSVPNRFYDAYGELNKIKAYWYEAKTQPIWIVNSGTESLKIYDSMQSYLNTDTAHKRNGNIPYSVATEYSFSASPGGGSTESMNLAYNMDVESDYVFPHWYYKSAVHSSNYMTTIIKTPSLKTAVSSDTLKAEWARISKDLSADKLLQGVSNSYNKNIFLQGVVDNGRTYGENKPEITNEQRINLLSMKDTHSSWELLAKYGFNKPKDSSIEDKAPIYDIKQSDLYGSNSEIAKRLLINEEDVDKIKELYEIDKKANKKTTLFRFAQTDYYSAPAYVFKNGNGIEPLGNSFSYLAQETVFLDFDVISLGFIRDGNYTIIPCVASPIDIIGGITPPMSFGKGDFPWWIIWLVLGIILFLLLWPLIKPVLKLIFGIIALPFKAVGKLFKREKNGKDSNITYITYNGKSGQAYKEITKAEKENARKRFNKKE